MKINASQYRLFSPQELRSYAEKGLLTFQGADDSLISEAILYMLEGLYTEDQVEKAKEEAYDEGKEESDVSHYVHAEIKRAIGILEELV